MLYDEVPEEERKQLAEQVADKILASLKMVPPTIQSHSLLLGVSEP